MIYPNIIIIIHDNGYTIQVGDELHGLYNYYLELRMYVYRIGGNMIIMIKII